MTEAGARKARRHLIVEAVKLRRDGLMLVEIADKMGSTPVRVARLLDEADQTERRFLEAGRAGLRPSK